MKSYYLWPAVWIVLSSTVVACANGGGSSVPLTSQDPAPSLLAPQRSTRTQALTQALRKSPQNAAIATKYICVGGTNYATVQDDEFSQDSTISASSTLLASTPAPSGAIWSTRAWGFASGNARNNVGTDDAYYTDPTRGFGGYNPFSLTSGALNITAEPVPSPYATASALLGAHWLSGLLESPALLYGYVEVSARIPNLQGFWPAPLWLLGLAGNDGNGDGYEELDAAELFGNALPRSTVQQTQIYSLSGSPAPNFVRTLVSPDPSTAFHTYGVLWTPAFVEYTIDHIVTSARFTNAAKGPANAIIILQVFAQHAYAPPPATLQPQTESLQYYRWYQSTGAGCSPTVIATSLPTPMPSPSAPATGVPSIAQNTGVIEYQHESTLLGQFAHAPADGDLLVAYLNTINGVTAPTGWSKIDGPNGNGYFVFTGVVGQNGLVSQKTYPFGLNWGTIQILDINGQSNTAGIIKSTDPDEWQSSFPRTLTVPKPTGLMLVGWGGLSYDLNGFSSIADAVPLGQSEKVLGYTLNDNIDTGFSFSTRVSAVVSEPYAAAAPFTATATIKASAWDFNGNLIWIPSGYQ